MPQNPHELAQVWEGFQCLNHADDALNVLGLEAPSSACSDFAEALVATHRIGNGATVITALTRGKKLSLAVHSGIIR
jgi:hypothetical protein